MSPVQIVKALASLEKREAKARKEIAWVAEQRQRIRDVCQHSFKTYPNMTMKRCEICGRVS